MPRHVPAVFTNDRTKLHEVINREDTMDIICEHVGSGRSIIELCEYWEVDFGQLSNWILSDTARNARYNSSIAHRKEYQVEKYLDELRSLGLSDIRQLYNEDNSLKDVSEWPDEVARAIKSVETDELYEGTGRDRIQVGYTKKVTFWDKTRAIELLGKNLGLFTDKSELTVKASLSDLVRESMRVVEPREVDSNPDGLEIGNG